MEEDTETPEDKREGVGAPVVLVAVDVKLNWTPPIKFSVKPGFKHIKYLLLPNNDGKTGSLFLRHMPGCTHGEANGHVGSKISVWVHNNQLDSVLCEIHSGGKYNQPDKGLRPRHADLTPGGLPDIDPNLANMPYCRLVCEVEYKHRNGEFLRQAGGAAFANPYTSLFLGIKIWKKGSTGFGGVAVLWEKNPASQAIGLLMAVDFGTKQNSDRVRAGFNTPTPPGVNLLPGVTPAQWQEAQLSAGYAVPIFGTPQLPPVASPARLTLPCTHLLHRISYPGLPGNNPYLLGPPPVMMFNDMVLDLNYFAYCLDIGPWD